MTISTNTEALNATALATRAIHAGQEPDPTTGAVVTPIYMTSTFKQDGVGGLRNGYSRSINPTRNSFDEQLAAVEGAKYALSFSSGLAAIDVLLRSTLKPGDNILLGNDVYGGTYRLLSKVFVPWGIGLDVVDITDLKAVETALASKHYQYVWVETPSNPLLNITDIAATTEVAHKYGTKVAVDNTFASPALQHPLADGVLVLRGIVDRRALGVRDDEARGVDVAKDGDDLLGRFRRERIDAGEGRGHDLDLVLRGGIFCAEHQLARGLRGEIVQQQQRKRCDEHVGQRIAEL